MPDPLHPALVHLPIGLAVVMPFAAIAVLLAIRSGALPDRSWALVVALQLAVSLGGWAAFETGGQEEERVERVVSERFIEAHEEAAERFLFIAIGTLIATAAGLLQRRRGEIGRGLAVLGSVATLAAAASVGHLGGQLVYVHGAAGAYVDQHSTHGTPSLPRPDGPGLNEGHGEDDRARSDHH